MGKIGRMHGLKMVRIPPKNAKTSKTIRILAPWMRRYLYKEVTDCGRDWKTE